MKGKVKVLRICKAIQILLLGCQIEIKRKRLGLLVKVHKTLSSESIITESNKLSKLGVKWMNLSRDARHNAFMPR